MTAQKETHPEDQERRKSEAIIAVSHLARQINASLDLQETLDSVVSTVAELIQCSLVEIDLWDEAQQMLVLQAIRSSPERNFPVGKSFPPGKGYTGWVVKHRRPLLVADVDKRRDLQPDILPGELPFKAYAGIPLLAMNKLIGVLVLVHDETGAFNEDDMHLLEALAGQAAIAISNARIHDDLAQRAKELETINLMAATVNQPADLNLILEDGLKQALIVTGLEMGAIGLRNPQDNSIILQCHHGMAPDFAAAHRERLSRMSFMAWPENVAVSVLIVQIDPDAQDTPAHMKEAGIRQTVNVPLFAEGKLVGALNLATSRVKPFSTEEQSLLLAIAHQLGTAIANTRLRQEALKAERLAAVGQVATGVAHDLRSPLGGILRSAEFLNRSEISPETRRKLIQAIVSLARRLISTSQGILDYVQEEKLTLKLEPCNLSAFLEEVLTVLQVDFSDQGIEVLKDFRYQKEVVMDADRMAQVIYNLAANARDVMPDGGTFSIHTSRFGKHVVLRFSDTGPGVPEELSNRIFEPFFSYGKHQGAGLGLAIARRIVEEHGGTIKLEKKNKGGAAFVIKLPV